MAKMSRNQLKSIIKECLVEVLIEGLNSKTSGINLNESLSKAPRVNSRKTSAPKPRPALDNISFNNKVQNSVSACTSDPILGDILKDTAMTTLQEQVNDSSNRLGHNHQVSVNGDPAAKMAASADPIDMFGDAANNWAALAFNSPVSDK